MDDMITNREPNAAAEMNDENVTIEGESKADKFKRLANKRTNNILKQVKNLGNLSTSAYEYTPEQVEKIFGAIQNEIDEARSKFEKTKKVTEEFSL